MSTDRIEPHVWRIAAVVVIGAILSILDTTIVNVALDTLSRDLHSPLADIQWVATGYMLALAAVIPVSGWAAGRFGAKRLWVSSVVLFTLGRPRQAGQGRAEREEDHRADPQALGAEAACSPA